MSNHPKRKKPVEWRDTCPEYTAKREFTLFVRNRYSFFGCPSPGKWRAALNFAANFAEPNRICFLYIFGTPRGGIPALEKAVANFPHHIVCAVYTDISDNFFKTIDNFNDLYKTLKNYGIDADKNVRTEYFNETKRIYKCVFEHKIPRDNSFYLRRRSDRIIIKKYHKALSRVAEAQESPAVCISNFTDRNRIIPDENGLNDIARELFFLGVESDTADENTVKITSTQKYICKAMDGDFFQLGITLQQEQEQLTLFDSFTKGATELVEHGKKYCREKIRSTGYFYLEEIWSIIEAPPFGAYDCRWYLYLFSIIMREYFSDDYRWLIRIVSVSGADIDPAKILTAQNQLRIAARSNPSLMARNPYIIYVEDESSVELAKLLSLLFDIPEERPHYKYSAHKHLSEAISAARQWCDNNTQTPLAWVDNRFYELLTAHEYEWCRRGAADRFAEWIRSDFDNLYRRIRTIDKDFDDSIIPEYGERHVALWRKCYYVKGSAVGWLHRTEDFEERMVHYMKKCVVCRECGRIIKNDNFPGAYEQVLSENGEELIFSPKDIIGANKKLLGRYQEEFFCLTCLCDVLDCTAEQLHEKIHFFKEQGCTLF